MSPSEPREVYFEFITIGATVKVVAIDAGSGTEVSVIAPVGAAQGGAGAAGARQAEGADGPRMP